MSQDLKGIFNSITPDNIKNIPIIQDAMGVFIETLEEISSESIDIQNALNNTNIKEELIKIYLDDLYNVLQQIQLNQKLIEYIERSNKLYGSEYFKKEVIFNIANYINDEHFLTIKSYKEKKGSVQAIKYIYDLISTFVLSDDLQFPFTLTELEPFNFKVQGSLPAEFYENIIRPLAHPLGFSYYYERILLLILEDFFVDLNFFYNTHELEVRTLKQSGEIIKFDFLNKSDGTKRVVFYTDTILEGSTRIKRIFFKDGTDKYNNNSTYLKQVTTNNGQTSVYYMQGVHLDPGQEYVIQKDFDGNPVLDTNGNPVHVTTDYVIKTFQNQSSIYHNYEFEFRTTLEENAIEEDIQTRYDYWARLDLRAESSVILGADLSSIDGFNPILGTDENTIYPDQIGEFYIKDSLINLMDVGYNRTLDNDNNIVQNIIGRRENYFSPSFEADLKLLEGKFEFVSLNAGPYLQVITKYGNTVKNTVSVSRVNDISTFILQNDGNNEYTAREHVYEDQFINLANGILIEPVYSSSNAFFDYNGVNLGAVPGPLNTIGSSTPPKYINDTNGFYVGYYDNNIASTSQGNPNLVNGLPGIYCIKTSVDGDPVNLQYLTYDVTTVLNLFSLSDVIPNFEETSYTTEESSREDYYGFQEQHNDLNYITDLNSINGFNILGVPFYDVILPGTDKPVLFFQTPAVLELTQGFNLTEENISEKTNLYEYCTYALSGLINDFNISEFYVSGELHSELVQSEIYKAEWTEKETGNDLFENFGCSVYRNDVLLNDNNYAMYNH